MKGSDSPPSPELPGENRAWRLWQSCSGFALHVLRRFVDDRCPRVAAELSYTTLLSLVPMLAVALAMLSAFPVFAGVRDIVQDFAFSNFVPAAGDALQEQFTNFLENAGKLTIFGILALGVTALLLLNTIEAAFNAIWRERRARPLIMRFLTYWAILTLGPLLIGSSIALSSYIFAQTQLVDFPVFTGLGGFLLRLLPFVLLAAGFMALYVIMPARPARWRHALAGGIVAALLFEVLKRLFALYIANFPSYEAIYGALSALPVLLIWMYLAWGAVLFGAEFAASIPEWRALRRRRQAAAALGQAERLGLALDVLGLLSRASRSGARRGNRLGEAALARETGVETEQLAPVLAALGSAGLAVQAADGRWLLACDLGEVSLYDLCQALGLGIAMQDEAPAAACPDRVVQALTSADAASRGHMAVSLDELIENGPRALTGTA